MAGVMRGSARRFERANSHPDCKSRSRSPTVTRTSAFAAFLISSAGKYPSRKSCAPQSRRHPVHGRRVAFEPSGRGHRSVSAFGTRNTPARSPTSYDKLVVATGASSSPPAPGLDLPGVFLLRWMGDTFAFENYLTSRLPKHVTIVGGGYIGLEMAEALTRRGISVAIVEMTHVMTTIDSDPGKIVGARSETACAR